MEVYHQRLHSELDITPLQKYEEARRLDPSIAGLDDAVKRVYDKQRSAATEALRRARQFDAVGRSADALKEYEKAAQLLPPDDPSAYAPLFTRKVVVDGEAHFRPSGAVSLIIARNIQLATPADAIWEQLPKPRPHSLADLQPRIPPPPGSNGMAQIIGQWPGDETDEQIQAALDELS